MELARACLKRIEALEPTVQAWAHLDVGVLMAQAQALDGLRQDRREATPLWGCTVGIKDVIDTAEFPTENGTPLHAGRRPQADAWVVQALKAAGALVVGKTVTTELATYHPGKTRNPHNPAHTPGGSSSGSAAAVACGMVDAAIGTQTNGSVIRPGAYCGVAAFKPSRHALSRHGVLVQSPTFDSLGLFAREVRELVRLFDALALRTGPPMRPLAPTVTHARRTLCTPDTPDIPPAATFAWWPTPFFDRTETQARAAWTRGLQALWADTRIRRCDAAELADAWLPAERIVALHRLIMEAEIGRSFAGEYGHGRTQLSASLQGQISRGLATGDQQRQEAQDELAQITASVDASWPEELDALILPASTGGAPPGLASTGDPIFCTVGTALDLPAVQVPGLRLPGGLPLGLQLLGRRGSDRHLLGAAQGVQATLAHMATPV